MIWNIISSIEDIELIKTNSFTHPCLIFKHSTRCEISNVAKARIESWKNKNAVECYFLDLIKYRELSDYIAEHFHVFHESPQILLISNGDCILDASHLDIRTSEIDEVVDSLAV